jgi:hypothetical protein
MWKEIQALPPDGRQSETALMIARGVRRLLRARGFSSVTELPLTDGRRAGSIGKRKGPPHGGPLYWFGDGKRSDRQRPAL